MSAEAWSAVAAFIAAGGGLAAWRAASKAAAAAVALTDIERRRWHHEMTPTFDVSCASVAGGAQLAIRFRGPAPLQRIQVGVEICDDKPHHATLTGISQDEVNAQIWGPYRIRRGVDGELDNGRRAVSVWLEVDDKRVYALDRTAPPHWATPQAWNADYADAPLRVALHCAHLDFDAWTLRYDVHVP